MIPTRAEQLVILCGGLGMRMRTAGLQRPKSLVKVGEKPVLWHLMKLYSHFGFRKFVLLLGYKGNAIVDYFERYHSRYRDFTMHFGNEESRTFHTPMPEDEREWIITFIQSGVDCDTGGRLARAEPYISGNTFLATYTDGLADVNIPATIQAHAESGLEATITSVRLPSNFGILETEGSVVTGFQEKPVGECEINAGFFVFSRGVFSYIEGDSSVLEVDVLPRMVRDRKVGVYRHSGYWQCMDTPKQAEEVNQLWSQNNAPWKLWED